MGLFGAWHQQRGKMVPEFLGPVTIHAWAFNEEEKGSAKQQDTGQYQAGLQSAVHPEIAADVAEGCYVFDSINNGKVEQINAVAHAADVRDE